MAVVIAQFPLVGREALRARVAIDQREGFSVALLNPVRWMRCNSARSAASAGTLLDHCFIIGDRETDIAAGTAAGMRCHLFAQEHLEVFVHRIIAAEALRKSVWNPAQASI